MATEYFYTYHNDFINLIEKSELYKAYLSNNLKKLFYCRLIDTKNDNKRLLEIPFDEVKDLSKECCKLFRQVPCPAYNYAGYEGQSAYKNALAHKGNFAFVTIDIFGFYRHSQTIYVKDVLVNKFGFAKNQEILNFLLKILIFNGHIPTGAPASPILAFLTHKELFDEIYEYTKSKGITFTLYYDDMTFSAQHGITMKEVNHIKNILIKHNLQIKHNKTRFYSYKKALITGYYVHQSGKISVPDHYGHEVIDLLKYKPIANMSKTELEKLIGKINHIQYVDKKAFKTVKSIACKQLSKLAKEQKRNQTNEKNNNN